MSNQNKQHNEGLSSLVILIMEKEGADYPDFTSFFPLPDRPLKIIRIK